MGKRLSQEDFISRSLIKHGDEYDYSKSEYRGVYEKIEIICKEHGSFWQVARDHMNGCGCPLCGEVKVSTHQRKSNEVFIEQSKEIHGDLYDYNDTNYTGNHRKVEIKCPQHGAFMIHAGSHLKGYGCTHCSAERDKIRENRRLKQEEIINRFTKKHGSKYDYSRVVYKRVSEKVEIVCQVHGSFWQTPYAHLKSKGCPKCSREALKGKVHKNSAYGLKGYYGTSKPSKMYLINIDNSFIKIGLAKSPRNRFLRLAREIGLDLSDIKVLKIIKGPAKDLFNLEQKLLRDGEFSEIRTQPDIEFGGSSECFKIGSETILKRAMEKFKKGGTEQQ